MAVKGCQYKNYSLRAKQNKVLRNIGTCRTKKYSGKGVNMLDWLQEILGDAYSDDIEKKISHEIGKGFISRADFNAANESKKSLEEQLRERDKQLETLKQLDAEGLQEKINTLQQENETTKQEYEKRITEIKFEHALSSALKGAKSKNDKAVQALLDMDALKLTESGEIIGLKEQLESLQKNDPYLFESDKKVPEIIGSTQGSPIGDDDAAMRAAFGLPINKGE